MTLNPINDDVVAQLRQVLPDKCFRPIEAKYLEEPRGIYHGSAGVLLAPSSVVEVAEIVRACAQHKIGIVPFGGGTGLVGGQVAEDVPAPVVLSLERMNRIRNVDAADNVIVAEAGAILSNVQGAAQTADRLFPLSLASEGSCQIGGNLSTNAGGVGVLRYGNSRDLCLGLEAVLPDGTIWNGLKRLRKDNTGYDLKNLLIGAEGSLGIITAASLKLFPNPTRYVAAVLQIPDPSAALDLLAKCQTQLGGTVSAFELIHRQGFEFLAEKQPQVRLPFVDPSEWMVLIDLGVTGDFDIETRLQQVLEDAFEAGLATDALIAQNEAQRQEFWAVRETIPEANRLVGAISSHDISVPVSRIPELINRGAALVSGLGDDLRINCFGHVGDGNLHYNVYPPKGRNRAEFKALGGPVKDAIYGLVDALGGSVSAEHGIGRMKTDDLLKYGDPAKLAAMRAIKAALDPLGIMNPGAVVAQNH